MTAAVKEIELPKYKMVILFVRRICSCSIFCRCIGDSVMSVCIFFNGIGNEMQNIRKCDGTHKRKVFLKKLKTN